MSFDATTIKIKCHHCDGTGKEPLGRNHAEVLQMVVEADHLTATEIQKRLSYPIGVTAINNRLEDLRKLNLVGRIKRSREWVYFANPVIKMQSIPTALPTAKTKDSPL